LRPNSENHGHANDDYAEAGLTACFGILFNGSGNHAGILTMRNQIDKIIERFSATWLRLLGAVRSLNRVACSFCPKCGQDLSCPCDPCAEREKDAVKWVWMPDGERVQCPNCKFTAHADWWQDWEVEAFNHQWRSRPQRAWAMIKRIAA